MWSLLLIGCMPLSDLYGARLVVKNMHQRDMCVWWVWHRTMHVLKIKRVVHSMFTGTWYNWVGLCDHLKRRRIYTLVSYNVYVLTLVLDLGMRIFPTRNCQVCNFDSSTDPLLLNICGVEIVHNSKICGYVGFVYDKICGQEWRLEKTHFKMRLDCVLSVC